MELIVGPYLVGLLVYGGVDPLSGVELENAFEKAFGIEANEDAWKKIGAAPLTRACLDDAKVRHDGTDKEDPQYEKYQAIQAHNERATEALAYLGYNGRLLQIKLNEDVHRRKKPVTVANSKERQYAISQAKTHGQRFHATGGLHLTSDDMFKGAKVNNKKRKIVEIEKDKKARLMFEKHRNDAVRIVKKEKLIN